MKKLLVSILTVGVVGAAAFAGANAFFSDTETSTGNTFTAGAIDLRLDNESYAIDYNVPGYVNPTGALVVSPNTSWSLSDLTVQRFFDFTDLKPGDLGEDTISVHIYTNNSWLCAAARVTENADMDCTSSEKVDDTTCGTGDALTNGDLANQVNFAFWKDDGDNVLEVGETPFLTGPVSSLNGAGQIALSDTSTNSVFGQSVSIPSGTDAFIGKAWCFGTLTPVPVAVGVGTPITRGTGFTCDGATVNNAAQTDKVVGDLQFYAVQARNNTTFTCAQGYTPVWPTPVPAP